ncbi:MAG TPA: dethiobiotin synthase [Acetobacteraceae bacterium]|nr:dethiobiotin synthase [Acetobacteraceae bacterium]
MSHYFVTATGTDIGKTFLTCGLIRAFRRAGARAAAIKPLVTGFDAARADESDSALLLAAMDQPASLRTLAAISPWRFTAPLSPDMAAAREGRAVSLDALTTYCRAAMEANRGPLFIEGIGGVMVPLAARATVRDWIAALDLPVLLVAGSYLGTLSHTLTAIEALHAKHIGIGALILNESENATVPVEETIESIRRYFPDIITGAIGRNATPAMFDAIARLI